MDGRKLQSSHECPIDDKIIWLCVQYNRSLACLSRTLSPNLITTWSLLIGLSSAWFLWNGDYLLAAVFFMVAYFYDCLDGNFARMYNCTSKFGDIFDHISDIVKVVAVVCIIFVKLKYKIRQFVFIILLALVTVGMATHLGCQECIYESDESGSLYILKKLCKDKDHIEHTRHFGVGTMIMYLIGYMCYLRFIEE
jgi:hypothetical protein